MDPKDLARIADPTAMAAYLAALPRPTHVHAPAEAVREDEYKGHRILVKATYEVSIDGRPLLLHLSLGNDGTVHCHSLPNYVSGSLMDVMHRLIDVYPEDFPPTAPPPGASGGATSGGHTHHAATTGGA
jgi:hypothetical protein